MSKFGFLFTYFSTAKIWIFYSFIRCIPCADGVVSVEIIEIWRLGLLNSTDHHVLYTVMYFFYQHSCVSIRIISARYLYLEKTASSEKVEISTFLVFPTKC